MRKAWILVIFVILFFTSKKEISASGISRFVNIVNPVRIAPYTKNVSESISAAYKPIKEFNLSATWLLTFDVLKDEKAIGVILGMDEKQEVGIFLEVSKNFSEESNVIYNDTGSWHHATSVFLSGYKREDRIKLIDRVLSRFYEVFGFYPKSVGSWWTDSFSLSYIREKYGAIANLGVADQFSMDGYQVWGQYFGVPFYPSKNHAGVPADGQSKIDIVTIQWALRDPVRGYKNSLYSTQDYHILSEKLDLKYFEWLMDVYLNNENDFGQFTIGLEADLDPLAYKGVYEDQIGIIAKRQNEGQLVALSMKEFGEWFREKHPEDSPSYKIKAENVVWYQSTKFRIGIRYYDNGARAQIFDFRSYHEDLVEPYFVNPNSDFQLSINVPFYIDEASDENSVWDLGDAVFDYFEDRVVIHGFIGDIPDLLASKMTLEIERNEGDLTIKPRYNWFVGKKGLLLSHLSLEAIHLLKSKKLWLLIGLSIIFAAYIFLKKKIIFLIILFLAGAGSFLWYKKNTLTYYVSQDEVAALTYLSSTNGDKVLIRDDECLQCSYETPYKPAVFIDKREYVENLSSKKTVSDTRVFSESDREKAIEIFKSLNVDYVYLVRYGKYVESLPFSPGDFGVEKIFGNANTQVWRSVK
ncbi:hypothetical protein A2961_01125 [Candidatus Woesebacteria bacterium RIFCSPLOWO2_01_FULL_39_21]|uniref:Uncharacterized protein n=1 Tax=Candidatus Woesebacteria bacterium RIFCSPLOWO2_01_FULL_39_21 TaxID=1802519 RepID=A0A1F8BHM0_9BACT|nr:MAG: hypothetical protein A2691_00195 [Candidatus Woesebacteria bacterium RIFCSPHIGHO2_01_FULL_39_23]OGM63551.1 MAG: hypothetical protein A2961_01125 [Candidatus Woesebacteria bacterium RIFCSPLOWO2_01_FULL_39_21]